MSVNNVHPSRPAPLSNPGPGDLAREGVTAGVDWASTEHAVAVVDQQGVELRWSCGERRCRTRRPA